MFWVSCIKLPKKKPEWLPGQNYCANHPHNFYLQIFAEIGVFGFFVAIAAFYSIIMCCYKARKNNPLCPMAMTALIVPIAFFFPLQQFGSFYGQWGNLFMWFAIGFAVAQYQGWRKLN